MNDGVCDMNIDSADTESLRKSADFISRRMEALQHEIYGAYPDDQERIERRSIALSNEYRKTLDKISLAENSQVGGSWLSKAYAEVDNVLNGER